MTTNNFSNSNQTKSQKQNFLAIAITAGIILLCVIGYLAYNNMQKNDSLTMATAELEESEKLRQELEGKYNQALTDLEAQKTTNTELNAMIDQQKADLTSQKGKIDELLKNKGKLDKARIEIDNLKSSVQTYLAEIYTLKSENTTLVGENTNLMTEKERLAADLANKSTENEALSSAKAQLVNEKEELSSKVTIASAVKVKSVTAVGQKLKGSGKVKDENSAKSVEQIKVCFTTLINDVVKGGTEQFHIRIINPQGETIAVESEGSGEITDKKTGDSVRFTMVEEMDYNNDEANACTVWAPTSGSYSKGKYQVQVYNKGYLAGTGAFELK